VPAEDLVPLSNLPGVSGARFPRYEDITPDATTLLPTSWIHLCLSCVKCDNLFPSRRFLELCLFLSGARMSYAPDGV